MKEQILSVPGKIYPGMAPELVNQPMNDYNDLRKVMAVKPEVLDAVSVLFAEQSGMLSEIMAATGGYLSDHKASKGGKYGRMMSNVKLLGNHEYTWRVANPSQWLYKTTRNAEGPGAATGLGAEGQPFYIYLNRLPLDIDDVMEFADGHSQAIIQEITPIGDQEYKCRVKLLARYRGEVLDPWLVEAGQEVCRAYNQKPEASEHGSKVRVSFGAWMRNYMTTMRWEWNLTGTAAHTKMNTQWLVYTDEKTGKLQGYWIPVLDYQMMKTAQKHVDHMLWNGVANKNPDGTFAQDKRGRLYYSGDGLYTQTSQKMRVAYNTLQEKHLEMMMKPMHLDSLEETVGTPKFVCIAGLDFRLQFDKLLRNVFRASPEVFYVAGKEGNGLKSNFKKYSTPLGDFFLSAGKHFDSKYNASLYDGFGTRFQSKRGVIVNVSDLVGGRKAAMLVSKTGRQHVTGTVNGMSNPGAGGVLTTTADVQGKHLLKEMGVASLNPYCLGEFYTPFVKPS